MDENDADLAAAARKVRETLQEQERGLDNSLCVATAAEAVDAAWADIIARKERRSAAAVKTGYRIFDDRGGLFAGELAVLAAVTSKGKTTLAMNIAANVAMAGFPVYVLSREMRPVELGQRLLQAHTPIGTDQLKIPGIQTADLQPVDGARAMIRQWPMLIDSESRGPAEAMDRAQRFKADAGGLFLCVIDYLQLLRGDRGRSRAEEVGSAVWAIKNMALDLDCPVLLISQFDRSGVKDKKAKDRPSMHHLKESGDIENTADIVVLMHLPSPPCHEGPNIVVELSAPKMRNGKIIGWPTQADPGVTILWRPWEMRFMDRPTLLDGAAPVEGF